MKPLKLFITAFGPYAGAEIVDFRQAVDAGLFGIYGPTGSGKSSIFSAIAFALFGEGARHEQPTTSMRSGHAGARTLTEVSFLFELGGKRYFVRRQPEQMRPKDRGEGETLHKHTAWLFDSTDIAVDDVSIDNCGRVLAEKKVGLVEKLVTELLGYDVDQFRQIVLLPQGQFERFLASDSNARLEILRGLFDVSLYQRMTQRLHDQAAAAQEEYRQGIALQSQQLRAAGFDSTDDLATSIHAADETCTELDAAAIGAEAVRAGAARGLADGESLDKAFDDARGAVSTLSDLEARQSGMDALGQRHGAAVRARQLIDLDDAITRTVTSHGTAKETEAQATERVGKAVTAEAAAQEKLDALLAKGHEIDALKQEVVTFERYATVLAGAADLKTIADDKEALLRAARALAGKARLSFETLADALDAHRKAHERAQGIEAERARLTALNDRVQQTLRQARDVGRGRTQLSLAKEKLAEAEQRVSRARLSRSEHEVLVHERQASFIAGQARLLAESLEHGEPCPVCGSADHPNPAHGDEPATGLEKAWRDAQALLDTVAREAQMAEAAHSAALSVRDERQAILDGLEGPEASVADLDAEATGLLRTIGGLGAVSDLVALADRTRALEGELKAAESERDGAIETERSAETAAALARQSYNDHISAVPDALRDDKEISDRRRATGEQIEAREQQIASAQLACRQAGADRASAGSDQTSAANRIAELEAELGEARTAYGNRRDELALTEEQYRAARPDIAKIATMAEQLETFREALTRAKARVEDTAAAIEGRERPDLDALRQTSDGAHSVALAATRDAANARAHANQLQQLLANLRAQMEHLIRLNDESGPLRALADAFEGRNALNVTLETYAVGAMFDQVLEAANLRFGPMSQGRYGLERDIQTVGGRRKRGLDIRVHDIQTGRPREVSTLSGGETFIAALALALGLSDIVEMTHGAIRLDTIFIDEGFGSLDSDSDGGTLDQVLQVLQDIVGHRRAVGLISHVPLVQQAVPNGFTVIKSPSGSRIEERVV